MDGNYATVGVGDRAKAALQMRRSGATYKQIGEKLDVSGERARQLCFKAGRYEGDESYGKPWPKLRREISCRAYNFLVGRFHGEPTLDQIASLTCAEVLRSRDVGRRTLLQLSEFLRVHGLAFACAAHCPNRNFGAHDD